MIRFYVPKIPAYIITFSVCIQPLFKRMRQLCDIPVLFRGYGIKTEPRPGGEIQNGFILFVRLPDRERII